MVSWYLVIDPHDSTSELCKSRRRKGYYGIGGTPWPAGLEKIESSLEYVELKVAGEDITFQLCTDKSAALPLKTMLVKDDYMTKFITENELCLSLGSTTSAVNVIQIYDELVIVVELKRNCR